MRKLFIVIILGLCLLITTSNLAISATINKIRFEFTQDVKIQGNTSKVELVVILPKSRKNRQEVLGITYSHQPERVFESNGNNYAKFVFYNPKNSFKVTVSGNAILYKYDLSEALKTSSPDFSDNTNLQKYLSPESFIESNSPAIIKVATSIIGADDLNKIKNIFSFVLKTINYGGYNSDDVGALGALNSRNGDCSEFSYLMVAICRAKGIPARIAYGYTINKTNQPKHAWVEVYTKKYGWIPFDPLFAKTNLGTFDSLYPIYLYLSNVKQDKNLNKYYYSCYFYWGAPINVIDSFSFSKAL